MHKFRVGRSSGSGKSVRPIHRSNDARVRAGQDTTRLRTITQSPSQLPACNRCRNLKKRCGKNFPACSAYAAGGHVCICSGRYMTNNYTGHLDVRIEWLTKYVNDRISDLRAGNSLDHAGGGSRGAPRWDNSRSPKEYDCAVQKVASSKEKPDQQQQQQREQRNPRQSQDLFPSITQSIQSPQVVRDSPRKTEAADSIHSIAMPTPYLLGDAAA